jgi:molybdopterin synthase sulfur carrier subunit
MRVRILYFAWVREKTGKAEEVVELPDGIETVAALVDWLRERGPQFADAFQRPEVIRAAVNRNHVGAQASLAGAREIAFFPPVTGG